MFYRFSVDDNIIFLKDLTRGDYNSIFEHEYLKMYKELHEEYDIKLHLNLFYQDNEFNLSEMTDRFKAEFEANSDWIQFSFHSKEEFEKIPYSKISAEEIVNHCDMVEKEILRFAGSKILSKVATPHMVDLNEKGLIALKDKCDFKAFVGLFGTIDQPLKSYYFNRGKLSDYFANNISYRDPKNDVLFFNNDIVLNRETVSSIIEQLNNLKGKEFIEIMIHEQYFQKDYFNYQPDFRQKLVAAFETLKNNGYKSVFLKDILHKYI